MAQSVRLLGGQWLLLGRSWLLLGILSHGAWEEKELGGGWSMDGLSVLIDMLRLCVLLSTECVLPVVHLILIMPKHKVVDRQFPL